MVGSAQERAAFLALRVEGQTVREAGQAIGVNKSQVTNLADVFQGKLARRMMDLDRKRLPVSQEYFELRRALRAHLYELEEESGSDDDWYGGHKIGNFSPDSGSREDLAELTRTPLTDPDE